jgi:transcriptional regulator with XRE-family HTH domain
VSLLAKRIAEQRKRKKLSQTKLAEKFGVGRSTVAMWETGDRSPDPETINKLADFFGCSTDYLYGRTDDPTPANGTKNEQPVDIRQLIREKMKTAHWGGHPLTKEDIEFLTRIIDAVINREEGKKQTDGEGSPNQDHHE